MALISFKVFGLEPHAFLFHVLFYTIRPHRVEIRYDESALTSKNPIHFSGIWP